MDNILQTINYIDYGLVCLILILTVGMVWLYYDLGAMTSRKEEWRFIALEREKMTKELKEIFNDVKETREG